jgi:hypothetical protein
MPRSTARNSPEVLGRPIDLQADDGRLHIKRAVLGSHGSQHSKADGTPRLCGTGDDSQCRRLRFGQSTLGEFLRNTLPIIWIRTHVSLGKDAPCTRPIERYR